MPRKATRTATVEATIDQAVEHVLPDEPQTAGVIRMRITEFDIPIEAVLARLGPVLDGIRMPAQQPLPKQPLPKQITALPAVEVEDAHIPTTSTVTVPAAS
jgi:hypothetical protein